MAHICHVTLMHSRFLGLPYVMEATNGRAPSLLSGHIFEGIQGYFILATAIGIAILELNTLDNVQGLTPTGYVPGEPSRSPP